MSEIVDQVFPPVTPKNSAVELEYNDFNYWRTPLPTLALDTPSDEVRPQARRDGGGGSAGRC